MTIATERKVQAPGASEKSAPAAATDFPAIFGELQDELASRGSRRVTHLRQSAIRRFAELGFPTTRHEEWRFTNVKPLVRTPLTVAAPAEGSAPTVTAAELERYFYPDCTQLVLVNGRLAPELSHLEDLPAGAVVSSLADAWQSHPALIDQHLGRYASFDEHAFVALNTAFHRDGVFLYVPKGAVIDKPINLIVVGAAQAEPVAFFPRLLFVAEESSQVTIFEQHVSVGDGAYFTCPVLEVVAGANSTIDHYKLQRESTDAFHMSTLQVKQHRDTNFSSHCLSWGGSIVRNDVNATLDGENCTSILNGLYMVEGKQLVDNHMRVEHNQPNCYSHELYKGILEGEARAVFTGRIYVEEDAQKTDAVQANRNLLLSNKALCNSQPQLEIFADDVRCTHGSTVGQLDELAIFYLRSRGIGEEAARSLLTYAFAADIVTRVKLPQVRRDLEEFLFRRLPKGEIVRQAV